MPAIESQIGDDNICLRRTGTINYGHRAFLGRLRDRKLMRVFFARFPISEMVFDLGQQTVFLNVPNHDQDSVVRQKTRSFRCDQRFARQLRQLLVDLTGVREPGADGLGHAVVTLSLSDPSLAMMDPEEIRARLRILPDMHWCSHWNDASLAVEGDAVAAKAAKDALDSWDAADEAEFLARLPKDVEPSLIPGLRRDGAAPRGESHP